MSFKSMVSRLFGGGKKRKKGKRYRGFGDVVKAGTSAVGIQQCDACKRRQAWLNRKVPFK